MMPHSQCVNLSLSDRRESNGAARPTCPIAYEANGFLTTTPCWQATLLFFLPCGCRTQRRGWSPSPFLSSASPGRATPRSLCAACSRARPL